MYYCPDGGPVATGACTTRVAAEHVQCNQGELAADPYSCRISVSPEREIACPRGYTEDATGCYQLQAWCRGVLVHETPLRCELPIPILVGEPGETSALPACSGGLLVSSGGYGYGTQCMLDFTSIDPDEDWTRVPSPLPDGSCGAYRPMPNGAGCQRPNCPSGSDVVAGDSRTCVAMRCQSDASRTAVAGLCELNPGGARDLAPPCTDGVLTTEYGYGSQCVVTLATVNPNVDWTFTPFISGECGAMRPMPDGSGCQRITCPTASEVFHDGSNTCGTLRCQGNAFRQQASGECIGKYGETTCGDALEYRPGDPSAGCYELVPPDCGDLPLVGLDCRLDHVSPLVCLVGYELTAVTASAEEPTSPECVRNEPAVITCPPGSTVADSPAGDKPCIGQEPALQL